MINNFQEKLEKLDAEYKINRQKILDEIEIEKIIPNIEFFLSREMIFIKTDNKDDVKTVLEKFPAINETQEVNNLIVKNPYRIDINNPPTLNSSNKYQFIIHWVSEKYEIRLTCKDIGLLKKFTYIDKGKITDSEYVHFLGMSKNEISQIRVLIYCFNKRSQKWYGRDETLTDESEITNIIEFLKS